MATKINPTRIDWDAISTGTIASGANLGLNSSDVLVKASVSGGGGISFDGSTANGILTYKDSDEATVEPYLTFDGSSLKLMSSADTGDYFTLTVGAAGTMVAATNDDDGFAANLTFDVDGAIYLDAYAYGTTILREGAQEYLRFQRAATGTDHAEIQNMEDAMDLIFKQYDGTETLRLTDAGDVKVTADIYVDKIRRASDSSTTTKILLNDEAIKLYAGHSSDNICTIDSTGLKIDNGSLETATIDYTDGDLSMTIADGGKVTFASGFAVGSDAAGDILYHNGTSYVRLAKGTADQVLTMNDGATAPNWEDASGGGSSNEYFHLHLSGRVRNTSGLLFGHAAYAYNAGDADWTTALSSYISNWTTGDSSFDATYANAMLYFTIGVAPAAMDLTMARIAYYMANDNMTDDYIWEIWKATPTSGTAYSTSLTWTRVGQLDRAGDPSSQTFYAVTDTFSSSNSLAAGDLIGLTVHNPGDTYTSKYHAYHLALRFTYT